MEEVDRLMQEMPRAGNPYPKSIFPMTMDDVNTALDKYLKMGKITRDAIFGAWGRYVWDMAIEAQCRLLIEEGWVKGDR